MPLRHFDAYSTIPKVSLVTLAPSTYACGYKTDFFTTQYSSGHNNILYLHRLKLFFDIHFKLISSVRRLHPFAIINLCLYSTFLILTHLPDSVPRT